jgi:hypothetical protein
MASPKQGAETPFSLQCSLGCASFLKQLGVGVAASPASTPPFVGSFASSFGIVRLQSRLDLTSGKLFSDILLTVRSWLDVKLSSAQMGILRTAGESAAVPARVWAVLGPLLDTTFDLYIPEDIILQLETVSIEDFPPEGLSDLETAVLELLEDLASNGRELITFAAPLLTAFTPAIDDVSSPPVSLHESSVFDR